MKKLKIYLVAGETSGDYLGAQLINALKVHQEYDIEIFGVFGNLMEKAASKKSLFPMQNIAVMGFFTVIKRLRLIIKRIKETAKDIEIVKPDIVITIDAQGFSKAVINRIQHLKNIKKVQFVAPTVWAWKPKRAEKIAKIYDFLICILPFEPPFFTKHGLKTFYIGHPIIENQYIKEANSERFKKIFNLKKDDFILNLLPGSRKNEIDSMLDIFVETSFLFKKEINVFLPVNSDLKSYVQNKIKHTKIILIEDMQTKYDLFKAANFSIATSGSVSLELSMAKTPFIICYKLPFLIGVIMKKIVKINYISLINIMYNKEIVKEFLQKDCNPKKIYKFINKNLKHSNYKQNIEKHSNLFIQSLTPKKNSTPSQYLATIILKKIL